MEKIYVGLIGKPRAGKGAVTNLIRRRFSEGRVDQFSFSQPLREALNIFGLPFSRDNTSPLADLVDRLGGEGTVSRTTINRAKASTAELIFLDGIRWPIDVVGLRGLENNFLVHIHADSRVRWERARNDPQKPEEATISHDDFVAREARLSTEKFIDQLIPEADFTINNNSATADFVELEKEVQRLFDQVLSTLLV